MSMENNKNKMSSRVIAVSCIAIVIFLLLNVAVQLIPSAVAVGDLTEGKRATPSEAGKKFLESMTVDVTLYVLDGDGSNVIYDTFLSSLVEMSDRLTVKNLKHEDSVELFKRAGYDVSGFTEAQWESAKFGILAESPYRVEYLDYTNLFFYHVGNAGLRQMGLTELSPAEYYKYVETFSANSNYQNYLVALVNDSTYYFKGEEMILQLVEFMCTEYLPTQYVLTGHGETAVDQVIYAAMLATYGKKVLPLDLKNAERVPAGASGLLILKPTSDYSEAEIGMLRDYLKSGGQITLVTGEENLSMTNLMGLMKEYGMVATPGAVCEEIPVQEESSESTESTESTENTENTENTEGGETVESDSKTELVYTVDVAVNVQHDSMAVLATEKSFAPMITNGNALSFVKGSDSSLINTALMTTSKNAQIGPDATQKGEQILAAAAETADGGRVVWFTGAESFLVTKEELSKEGSEVYNNFCLYLGAEWTSVVYKSNLPEIDPIPYSSTYLTVKDTHVGVSIAIFAVLVIVLAILAFWMWMKRRSA